jgi:putative spermidine/putrescine transport system substrate-binding protein
MIRPRDVLLLVLALLGLGAIAPDARAQQRFDGVTLRVATFGGAWRDIIAKEMAPKFAALGGKLEFITGSPQANLAKLVAGRGRAPFDVVDILDAQLPSYLAGKYLAKLDPAQLPNTKYLGPTQFTDEVVQSWETQEGVCYNADKFKELGLKTPTSYADLAQPALAGRVMLPDINSGGGLAAFGGFAYTAGGDEVNFKPGVDLMSRIKEPKLWMQGDQVVIAFRSGDIYAAAIQAGWCLITKNAGVPVVSLHPVIKPGVVGVAKIGWLGVVATTSQLAAAEWYLNTYLDTEVQYAFAVADGVVPVNRDAIARLHEDPTFASMLFLDPKQIATELRIDYAKVNMADWIDGWNQMVSH